MQRSVNRALMALTVVIVEGCSGDPVVPPPPQLRLDYLQR
jgi:hypothetical protein